MTKKRQFRPNYNTLSALAFKTAPVQKNQPSQKNQLIRESHQNGIRIIKRNSKKTQYMKKAIENCKLQKALKEISYKYISKKQQYDRYIQSVQGKETNKKIILLEEDLSSQQNLSDHLNQQEINFYN